MMKRWQNWVALVLILMALLLLFVLSPIIEKLPSNYANTIYMSQVNQMRSNNNENWQESLVNVIRKDQTIIHIGDISIIEGSFSVYYETGQVNFEISNRYGVNQYTRANKAGFGNADRSGQFYFPIHTQPIDYILWDPMYNGLCQVRFERKDRLANMKVLVFSFTVSGLDETEGYSYMPQVPEKYLAYTNGSGTIWVEPVSGTIVDYQDNGASYFVDPMSDTNLEDFNRWSNFYTSETREIQIHKARIFRIRTFLIRIIFPTALGLAALFLIFDSKRNKRSKVDMR